MKKRKKAKVVVINHDTIDKLYRAGIRVVHPEYGYGTIVRREKESPINPITADLRHKKQINIGVKFDKGGPQGWAEDATHDITQLRVVA